MTRLSLRLAAFALPACFWLSGCHVSQTTVTTQAACPVAGPTQGACTVTVGTTVTIVPNAVTHTVGVSDLSTVEDGSYVISVSAPSSFTATTSSTPTTTLSVETDQGYTSSITLGLTQVAAAIAPVNSGDAVYSFNLKNSAALESRVQKVAAKTTSTMTLTSTGGLPIQSNGSGGAFTFTTVLTSNSTGNVNGGDATLNLTAVPPPSKPIQYY